MARSAIEKLAALQERAAPVGRAAERAGDLEAASGFYRQLLKVCPAPTGGEHPQPWHAAEFVDATAAAAT